MATCPIDPRRSCLCQTNSSVGRVVACYDPPVKDISYHSCPANYPVEIPERDVPEPPRRSIIGIPQNPCACPPQVSQPLLSQAPVPQPPMPQQLVQQPQIAQTSVGPPQVGPPPNGRYDLWDLRFDRWWGWTWVRKQQQNNNSKGPRRRQTPDDMGCVLLKQLCRKICGSNCCQPPARTTPPSRTSSPIRQQSVPPQSVPAQQQYVIAQPVNETVTFCQPQQVPPPQTQMRSQIMRHQETYNDCCCPVKKPRRETRREHKAQCQSWVKEKTSSSSSEECGCNTEQIKYNHADADCCMSYLDDRVNNATEGCNGCEGMNPLCCPCQEIDCSCCQNICCSCAQDMQMKYVQKLTQECSKKKTVKKKRKVCCTCTQTQREVRDKHTCTRAVPVSDACVCCKPKQPKKPPKPKTKVCCVCKRPNLCPGKCCPCAFQKKATSVCCPCLPNLQPMQTCCGHSVSFRCNNECEESNSENSNNDVRNKNRNCCECPNRSKETRNDKTKSNEETNQKRKSSMDMKRESIISKSDDTEIYNLKTENIGDWIKDLDNKYLSSKSLGLGLNWINDLLKKPPPPYNFKKLFPENIFSSPFTRQTYNLNVLKINDIKQKNHKHLDPMEIDDSVEEIKAAVGKVDGDKEHRQLLTAVCDALLSNKSKEIEFGDSSLINEFTYPSKTDLNTNVLRPLNLYNNYNNFINDSYYNYINNKFLNHKISSNFCNFTQTENVFNRNSGSNLKNTNTMDNTTQFSMHRNPFLSKHVITDPINALFNEKTQTEVDELYKQYTEKFKFPNIIRQFRDENCEAIIDNEGATTQTDSGKSSFTTLKDPQTQNKHNAKNASNPTKNNNRNNVNYKSFSSDGATDIINIKQLKTHRTNSEHGLKNNEKHENSEKEKLEKIYIKNKVTKTPLVTSSSGAKIQKQAKTGHSCCDKKVLDYTELSIRSPLNIKQGATSKIKDTKPKEANVKRSVKQLKRTASSLSSDFKKPKISKIQCENSDIKKEVIETVVVESKSSQLHKSKIPVRRVSRTLSSASNCSQAANSVNSLDLCKEMSIILFREDHSQKMNQSESLARDIFVSPKLTAGKSPESKANELSDTKQYCKLFGAEPCSRESLENEDIKHNTPKTSNYELNSTNSSINYFSQSKESLLESDHQLLLKDEVELSDINYELEQEIKPTSDDYIKSEIFNLNDFLVSQISLESHKSLLSMIKEENESDLNLNSNSFASNKFIDTNTSPFDFENVRPDYIDSCSSPFDMKKPKERKVSFGMLCFSSGKEKDSEPYHLSGSGNESTSTNSDTERPRSKEKKWFFK